MSNMLLSNSYIAGAAVPRYRIVRFSAAGTVVPAASGAEWPVGVSHEVSALSGERLDVIHVGVANVEAGAAISVGAVVTSDASGRAVASAPAAGVNERLIGIALEDALAAGEIIRVLVVPSRHQG